MVVLPALLAASTLRQTTGAELMAGYAVGAEIIMRLGEAVTLDHCARGFHSTATLGTIGVAGGVSRLLNLSEAHATHALALSMSQTTGYALQFGSNAKLMQAASAARNGLAAALFAAKGATGQPHVLDHARGFAGPMGDFSADRFREAMNGLGAPWALGDYGLVLKPWPSCSYTHRLVTAALELRPSVEYRLSDIVEMHATLPDFHAAILPFDRPDTRAEALFSLPACVGQILVSGTLALDDSENGFWERPDVARLIRITTVRAKPARRSDLNYDTGQPDVLRIGFGDGEMAGASCLCPLGAPQNPMTIAQLGAKFSGLTSRPEIAFSELLDWPATTDIAAFFKGFSHAAA